MAVAALAPDAAYELNGPASAISPALAAFMWRIKVRADDSSARAGYPQAWAAQVSVRRRPAGTSARDARARRSGAAFGEGDLKAKFRRVAAPVLEAEQADAMFAAGLAAVDDPAVVLRGDRPDCRARRLITPEWC